MLHVSSELLHFVMAVCGRSGLSTQAVYMHVKYVCIMFAGARVVVLRVGKLVFICARMCVC